MRRSWAVCAVFVALIAIAWAVPREARADEGWTIDRFAAQITIQPDGTLAIVESIDVDFGTLRKHGIFREIPIEYTLPNDNKHNRLYGFTGAGVSDSSGKPWPFAQSRVGANVQLKIGDANQTVSGKQTYRISYTISGVLNGFPDHDELYWNVNGFDWPVPTGSVAASVLAPGYKYGALRCFEGALGETRQCRALVSDQGEGALFMSSKRPFASGENMTIVVALPKGTVAPPTLLLTDKPKNAFERYFEFTPLTIIGAAIALVLGLVFFASNWWRNGRDRSYTSVYYLTNDPTEQTRPLFHRDQMVVEYAPPDDLRPGQMGVLLDERADTKDASATIIDLAVRGYLTIEETEKSWAFGKKDWKLTKKKEPEGLLAFEQTIFNGLFADGDVVQVSDLKNKYHTSLAAAQAQLYDDTVSHGWFGKSPDAARTSASGIAVAIGVAGAAAGYGLGRFFGAALIGVPIVAVALLMLATSAWMPKRTAKGSEALRRVLGFRLYMTTAETRRQEFNEKANIFAAYLPYAIVFGCVDKWAHVFRDIDTKAATAGWYYGAAAFSAPDFSRSMETFASSVSHVISSTPGSSGGSGFSGGSSGGGGGGGGGGSW